MLDPTFGHTCNKIELDLGCGKGGFSIELAKRNPQSLVLAVDIKASRLKRINNKAAVNKLTNVETIHSYGWDLIGYRLPDNSVDRIHVICPDPWPKARHSHNRMLTSEFIGRMKRILKQGGILHLATDDQLYLSWIKEAIAPIVGFVPFDEGIDDVRDIRTEFELQFLRTGKGVTHLSFRLEY